MSRQGQGVAFPPQHQASQPGLETKMRPQPVEADASYPVSGKLRDKVALITGGDSGIGEAVAILFAREGADIAIVYYDEHEDARNAQRRVQETGRRCLIIPGDVGQEAFCRQAVAQTVQELGHLDILVNNAGMQLPRQSIEDITAEQLERTFASNIFAMFYLVKAALPHFDVGSCIINTASVTAYEGAPVLLDYSATKGAVVTFTRSLSQSLVGQGIRVNAVAPGPVWTPLTTGYPPEKVARFGENTPMKRAAQPEEIAPSFLFLANNWDASYVTGQVLHPNGGQVVNT